MKKQFKMFSKKILALSLLFVTLFNICVPVSLFANDNPFTITLQAEGTHTVSKDEGNTHGGVIIDGNYYISFRSEQNTDVDVSVECNNKVCTITSTTAAIVSTPGGDRSFSLFDTNGHVQYNNTPISSNKVLLIENFVNDQPNQPQDPNEQPHPENNFDGKAVLVWSCSDGSICYHKFTGLGNNGWGTTYYNVNEVTDERTGEKFNVNPTVVEFTFESDFDNFVSGYKTRNNVDAVPWGELKAKDYIATGRIDMGKVEADFIEKGICDGTKSREEIESCVNSNFDIIPTIDPLEGPKSDNSYSHYGDRNFKVTIHTDDYLGVTLGNPESFNYIPEFWNQAQFPDAIDISTSTADDPKTLEAVLIEDTITITSKSFNGKTFTKVEPVNVLDGAVNVTNNNGVFTINFKSNYYDRVLFKITDSSNGVHYLRIARVVNKVSDNFAPGQTNPGLSTDVYYDKNDTYSNYQVLATLVYKDGSKEIVELEVAQGTIDDGLGNPVQARDRNAGKNLKSTRWVLPLDNTKLQNKEYAGVYFNVIKTNEVEEGQYAGTYLGHGEGIFWNIDARSVDYDL